MHPGQSADLSPTIVCVGLPSAARALEHGADAVVLRADSIHDALALLDDADCVVSDDELPDGSGVDLFRAARALDPDVACVLYTHTAPEQFDHGPTDPVVDYLARTEGTDALLRLVSRTISCNRQTSYPLPDDEHDRLATVRGLSAPSFERLAYLAASLFSVTVVRIGLVGRRTYRVLGSTGEEQPLHPRGESPCTYTILEDDVLTTTLQDDPRFVDSAAAESGLSWYAGVPVSVDGHAVGTVCLLDGRPRDLDPGECYRLWLLAEEVASRLRETNASPAPDVSPAERHTLSGERE